MIYKVEIRGEKEREAIEIDREVERKVRLGVKCKAATNKKLKCLSAAKNKKWRPVFPRNESIILLRFKVQSCYK